MMLDPNDRNPSLPSALNSKRDVADDPIALPGSSYDADLNVNDDERRFGSRTIGHGFLDLNEQRSV